MAEINILSPHLADMIAAGEVVERPASVIKELVENSIDAGAKNITVEIRSGGGTFIRVSDDGKGMTPEDAGIAFLRHATSKLRDEAGLEAIGTMGFRGEALAAISAVSHVELTTRRADAPEGVRMTLSAGDIQEMTVCGCPRGTVMTVKDLFFNTPARMKFMKSDRSEATACQLAALRCALGNPGVSVKFIRDGEEQFFSPGDGRQDSCVYTLLGRDLASQMLACIGEDEQIGASGYVSSPSAGRGNRAQQYFFCNGRFIRSPLLQTAVEQAYKNTLLTGRYPACVIYLRHTYAGVDVNVHPAKTEVKFTDEKKVFDLVYYAVLSALEGESRTAEVTPSPSTRRVSEPRPDFYRSMSAKDFRDSGYAVKNARLPEREMHTDKRPYTPVAAEPYSPRPTVFKLSECDAPEQTGLDMSHTVRVSETPQKAAIKPAGERLVEKPVQNVEKLSVPYHKIVGEALKTYIIVEQGEELILIDKHACHERIIFDKLKALGQEIMSQTLITPVTVHPDGDSGELIEANGELLTELGFEIEPYGQSDFVVRAVPYDMAAEDVVPAVEEICEKLKKGRGADPAGARDEILHTVACKAAIKAGWDTDPRELEKLVEKVLSGEVKYCPHGRPVSQRVTRRELDKLFKRIV